MLQRRGVDRIAIQQGDTGVVFLYGRYSEIRYHHFFQRARREAASAEILVVNHHLLFTDLAVRRATNNFTQAAVLPPYRHLILDDVELLKEFGERLSVGFSVPTDDDRVRKKLEPNAPKIALRLKTMQALRTAGIRVTAAVAPVLDACRRAGFEEVALAAAPRLDGLR